MPFPSYRHDPSARLEYVFDLKPLTHAEPGAKKDWLAVGETITTYTITASTGLVLGTNSESDGAVTVWVEPSPADTYTVSCKFTTSAGRTDERSITIQVVDR